MMKSLLFILTLICQPVHAAVVTWSFTGNVTDTFGGLASDLLSIAPIGSVVNGTIKIDTSTPRAPHSGGNDPNHFAQYYGAVLEVNVAIGNDFNANYQMPINYENYISIHNNSLWGNLTQERDLFLIGGMGRAWIAPEVSGSHLFNAELLVLDPSALMVSGLDIPSAEQLNGGNSTERRLRLSYGEQLCCSGSYLGTGGLDIENLTFSTVLNTPIPASAWLFGSGVVGLLGFARRKAI